MSPANLRTAQGNRLLAALPRAALERVLSDVKLRPLEMRQVVQTRKQRVSEVIFPVSGV